MHLTRPAVLRLCVAVALVLAFAPAAAPAAGAPQRVIVAYEAGHGPAVRGQLATLGASECADLAADNAVAVLLPPGLSKAAAAGVPGVVRVEDDVIVHALAKPVKAPPAQPAESLPWGVDAIEADAAWATTIGDTVKVAVIDTGIDRTHPDLVANLAGGYNAINPALSWTDDNGHGTHVAGIVAAADNEIGVVGVAPALQLYGVKVLNKRGSGYTSDIIEGIDWAIAHDADVINMSLGSAYYSPTFAAACARAIDAGIVIVAAAGNEGTTTGLVSYPARYPGVIGVSATDPSNTLAYFSSYGTDVDLAAPGVGIPSTYKGGTYATMSGTSMASPHVAGVVALVLTRPDGNDGVWTPAEVQARLESSAQDLGTVGKDPFYGAGLVRADLAVQ